VETPAGFDANQEDLILHFGAVDQFAEVRVNGMSVVNHAGGYLPFSAIVTEFFPQGGVAEVVVRVRDETDTSCWSRGKQSSKPGGIWYTPQSGIWQTVWMERVPKRRIESLRITPLFDEKAVELLVWTNCAGAGSIRLGMSETTFTDGIPVRYLPEFRHEPETPKLMISALMERDALKAISHAQLRSARMRKGSTSVLTTSSTSSAAC
jgi:hypothetical protein